MHRLLIVAVAALPLAACSKGPTVVAANASTAEVANQVAASGTTLNLNPGRWEGTTTVQAMTMPGVPAEMQKSVASEIRKPTTIVSCIKPEDIKDKHIFKGLDDDKTCKYSRFEMGGGRIDAVMTCDREGAHSSTSIAGTFNGDTMHMEVASDTQMPHGAGVAGTMSMKMTMDQKRVGECRGTEDKE